MAPLNEESVQEVAVEENQEVELTPEQKKEHLEKLMAEGRRELRAGNFSEAAEQFSKAAQLASGMYGEFDIEKFEVLFMYGRALVEVAGVENDRMLTAMTNIKKKEDDIAEEMDDRDAADASMTEEEAAEVKEMVADAIAENAEELEAETEAKAAETEGTEEESEKKADETEEESSADEAKKEETSDETTEKLADVTVEQKEGEGSTEEETDEAVEKEESDETAEKEDTDETAEKEDIRDDEEGDEEQEDEEEPDTCQIAWEALEVARRIAEKKIADAEGGDEWRRKLADVFIQLGQSMALDEKYEEALVELGKARTTLGEIASAKGDRLYAEMFFHEGRINRFRNEFSLAAESFLKASEAMKVTVDVMKSAAGDAPSDDQKEEWTDLEAVIADFNERAEDCKASELQKNMVADMAQKEKETEKQPSILTSSNANSDATANDISSLVRKKRVHEESEAETAPKKAKSEETEDKGEENIAV